MGESYSCESGGVIAAGLSMYAEKSIYSNGVWTWFSDPRAVYYNGATYVGSITAGGTPTISKYVHATGVSTQFLLHSLLERDDHNNPAIHIRPDGRIICFYSKHNDYSGIRYRISTNPEDISAFDTEQIISGVTLPTAYSNPRFISAANRLYYHYRAGVTPDAPHNIIFSADDGVSWSSEIRLFDTGVAARPYVKSVSNGVDRIDFLLTNCHPNEGAASIYHCYAKWESGTLNWYNSSGVALTLPINPATECTLIYSGTSIEGWVWDIAQDADGYPRVLFARFASPTDHRYMFARWTGSAWTTPVEITSAGQYLYAAEAFYSPGICFDSADVNTVYLSKPDPVAREIQVWKTTDNGAAWAKTKNITYGSPDGMVNGRPYSPRNHHPKMRVVWWSGNYISYTDYTTSIKGA